MILSLLASAMIAAPADAHWPQWRGPTRDGLVPAASPWPDDLKNFQVIWNVKNLGPSYSGPIVSANLVFTTETVDKKTEVASAYDRTTGERKWRQEWPGAMTVPFFAASNGSWIRSTPALDGDSLFVAGIRDELRCLDAATGEVRWVVDFMKEFNSELPTFGCVCSPLVLGDAVYIQAGAGFVKLNKKTGKVHWRVLTDDGGMMGSAFSSPIVGSIDGKSVLFVQTRMKLAAVDPDAGTVLFEKEIPSFRGMNILTPAQFEDGLFTSTYGGTSQLLKIQTSAAGPRLEDGWKVKYEGNMTSPVVINNHAYFMGRDQKFVCIDLKAGKQKWRSDRTYGKYWNLVANGDRILALDQRGILYLIKANPEEFELLAEKKLETKDTWAHLAVVGEQVAIRDLNGLTLYRWTK